MTTETTDRGPATTYQELWGQAVDGLLEQALALAAPPDTPAVSAEELAALRGLLADSPVEWDEGGDALLTELDRKLTDDIDRSVSAVLHHPTVAGLRRRWAGVENLLAEPSLPRDFRLHLLQATPAGLGSQLRSAGGDIEQTGVYKQLALAAYGSIPHLAVDWDHPLGGGKLDTDLLHLAGRLGEKGLFLSLLNVGPKFFTLDSFADLPTDGKGVRALFETRGMGYYAEFRKETYARFVGLCFPAAYAVTPFSEADNPAEGFADFTEVVAAEGDLVPVGAAAAMLQCVARSIGTTGWPAAIVGEDWGGKVAGLVARAFSTGTGEERGNATTQMIIHEPIELPLTENGITALVAKLNSTFAAFFAGATASRVLRGLDPKKSAESAMAASLPNMLVTVRFAHHVKALERKLLGSQKSPAEVESGLQAWANRLVLDQENASDEAKAVRPFRSITVRVQANPELPGYLSVNVTVVPHYRVSAVRGAITIAADPPEGD